MCELFVHDFMAPSYCIIVSGCHPASCYKISIFISINLSCPLYFYMIMIMSPLSRGRRGRSNSLQTVGTYSHTSYSPSL